MIINHHHHHIRLLSRPSRKRKRLNAIGLSICLSVSLSVAKIQKHNFLKKLNNLELWSLLTTYKKSYMGFSKNPLLDPQNPRWRRSVILKIDMTLFFCRGWSDLDKISQTGADDMSTAVIWSKSKPEVEFQYGGVWANLMSCNSTATCHIVGRKNSIRHIENRFSPNRRILFFVFLMQFGLWRAAAFVSSSIHLLSVIRN